MLTMDWITSDATGRTHMPLGRTYRAVLTKATVQTYKCVSARHPHLPTQQHVLATAGVESMTASPKTPLMHMVCQANSCLRTPL